MILYLHDADPLDICMIYYCEKIFFDKMIAAMRTWTTFFDFLFFYREGHSQADQLPQFLMEHFDIMPT